MVLRINYQENSASLCAEVFEPFGSLRDRQNRSLCYSDEDLRRGPVAQLGARFHGMEEVVSSNLTRSTNLQKFTSSPSLTINCEQSHLSK